MINKATNTCPVCGHEQERGTPDCTRCGWDFSPLLGTPEQVEVLLQVRLDQARTTWRQRRYDPDLIPELERDPFETPDEFTVRLTERPWYVGEGELLKAEYDIETRRFPLGIRSPRPWANPLVDPDGSHSLRLPRDQARELYQRGVSWPLFARLAVNGCQVSLTALVLVAPDGELPVETEVAEDHTTRRLSKAAGATTGPLISGRYRDIGDGTLLDIRTGLQWMRCALGQRWNGRTCDGEAGSWTWNNLNGQVRGINQQGGYGGHTDWCVPTIDELKTLIVEDTQPAIDLEAFSGATCMWYWSSSPCAGSADRAWYVDFNRGYVYDSYKNVAYYVRLVRGGQ